MCGYYDKIESAYYTMEGLIIEGWEFPDAQNEASNLHGLSSTETKELQSMYDAN